MLAQSLTKIPFYVLVDASFRQALQVRFWGYLFSSERLILCYWCLCIFIFQNFRFQVVRAISYFFFTIDPSFPRQNFCECLSNSFSWNEISLYIFISPNTRKDREPVGRQYKFRYSLFHPSVVPPALISRSPIASSRISSKAPVLGVPENPVRNNCCLVALSIS